MTMTVVQERPPRSGRLDPDSRGGLRLTLAAVAGLLLAVPFALLLLLVADHWGPLQRLDVRLERGLNRYSFAHPAYVTVMKGISLVGEPLTFEVLAVVLAVVLFVRRRPRAASWLVVTALGGELLSTVLKQVVGRQRPLPPHPVAHAASASFPSGHSLGVVVGVGALLLVLLPTVRPARRRLLVLAGLLVVLAVGFSRLALGVHYLSDVLGGYILGAGWLTATTAAFAAWRRDWGAAPRPLTAGLAPDAPEEPTT